MKPLYAGSLMKVTQTDDPGTHNRYPKEVLNLDLLNSSVGCAAQVVHW